MSGKSAGIDFGLKTYLTFSDNKITISPEFFKQNKKEIRRKNRTLSRKIKYSKGYKKARKSLARIHKKIANCRMDFHFKEALRIVTEYDTIFLENLNIKAMKKLWGRKVSDLGFSYFVKILENKAIEYGKLLLKVGKFFPSSKTCSSCGNYQKEITLKDRVFNCKECGLKIDRDFNASINIREEGIQILKEEGASSSKLDRVNLEEILVSIDRASRIPCL